MSEHESDDRLDYQSDLILSNKDLKTIMEWFDLIEESAPDNFQEKDHKVGKKINDYLLQIGLRNTKTKPVTNLYMVKTSRKSVAVDDKHLVIVENKAVNTYIAFAVYFVFIGILLSIQVANYINENNFNIVLITSFVLFFIYIIFLNIKREISTIELKDIKEIVFKKPEDNQQGYINFILDKQAQSEKTKIYFTNNKLRDFEGLKTVVSENKSALND